MVFMYSSTRVLYKTALFLQKKSVVLILRYQWFKVIRPHLTLTHLDLKFSGAKGRETGRDNDHDGVFLSDFQ